jgi:hypothetical protein
MSWRIWLGALSLALTLLLAGGVPPPAAAADPLGDNAYAAWAADHAQRLLRVMQLPEQFTIGDLRDVAAQLRDLIAEARAVEPPSRYAAAHRAYLAGVEALDPVRTALETIAITRQPAPDLADALFDAGQRVATGLHQLRDAGVAMPAEVAALLDTGPDLQALPAAGAAGDAGPAATTAAATGTGSPTQAPVAAAGAGAGPGNPGDTSGASATTLNPIAIAPPAPTGSTFVVVGVRPGVAIVPQIQTRFGRHHRGGPGLRFGGGGAPGARSGPFFTR